MISLAVALHMALTTLPHPTASFLLPCFLALGLLSRTSSGFYPNTLNVSVHSHWSPARATWYGSAAGFGSAGGACGYGDAVGQAPFSSMAAGGGTTLYKAGKGCGSCYQVKCTGHEACSGEPVTVVITDECPTCQSVHFDLSGAAFAAMAVSGQAEQLQNAGQLDIQHARVPCDYEGMHAVFHVDPGSNPFYFAVIVEFLEEDGDVSKVELQDSAAKKNSDSWMPMQQSWGADWKLDAAGGKALEPPFSIRLTSESGKALVAADVIPQGWQAGATYRSVVNF